MSIPKTDEAAVRAIIRALRGAGWRLEFVDDGEELVPTATEAVAIETVMSVDQATLSVTNAVGATGWVLFVLGNDPEEVACNYTANLSDAIDPLTDTWYE